MLPSQDEEHQVVGEQEDSGANLQNLSSFLFSGQISFHFTVKGQQSKALIPPRVVPYCCAHRQWDPHWRFHRQESHLALIVNEVSVNLSNVAMTQSFSRSRRDLMLLENLWIDGNKLELEKRLRVVGGFAHLNLRCRPSKGSQTRTRL